MGQESEMEELACHNNHHSDLNSVGSHRNKVEEEEVNYMSRYDPKGLDVTKTKELEGLHSLGLSISEKNVHIDNVPSHLYGMQMLQVRMSGVTEE
ncbi:hypothetical protein HAX54_006379 [Datura stramonium]|uniref:Uncharacterized protein n=1 Tax=Datura stramonium TaxID=4076 RepID=A0ABS8TCK3_DATST|nr:hypothetical protein [Datura stramonium]